MVDVETVIKALECCLLPVRKCKECPYDSYCYHESLCDVTMFNALDLLRKQQTEIGHLRKRLERKSKWIVNTKKYGNDNYHCLLCGAVLEKEEETWHYWQYCYHCGAHMVLMDGTDRDYDKEE